jgi:hypothetical protein
MLYLFNLYTPTIEIISEPFYFIIKLLSMVEILPGVFELDYLGSKASVDTVTIDKLVIYKINLSHPLFIKRVIDDKGKVTWQEEGAGKTEQSAILGRLIEKRLRHKEKALESY